MNKLLWLCIFIISAGFLFTACNDDPYKNMRLIVEQSSIEIVLNHDADSGNTDEDVGDGEEPEVPANTAYLQAHIENNKDNQSDVVLFDIVDKSLATISVTQSDGVYTAEIVAVAPGETEITVMSEEGGRIQRVPLRIVEPITGLAFDPDFSLAVAVGQTYQFTNANLNYEPALTNQKDVVYSMATPVQGVSITESGLLQVTSQPTESYITIVATSVANPELATTTQVYIYNALQDDQIHLFYGSTEIVDNLSIGKNTNFNNIVVDIVIDDATEQYIAYAVVDDASVIRAERVSNENLSFKITGIEQSQARITFRIGIVGVTEQIYIEKILSVQIYDLIDTIYVNGASEQSTVTVFDTYANTSDTIYGTRVLIEVTPTNSQSKYITFTADTDSLANLSMLEFYTASGQVIPDITAYEMTNNGVIYVRPRTDIDFSEFSCRLTVVANSNFADDARVYNEITINAKNGITDMAFSESEKYIDLANSEYQEFEYIVNGYTVTDSNIATILSGYDLDDLSILVQRPNVLSAVLIDGKLYIRPLSTGTTTLTLRAPNGISTEPATITVVEPTNSVVVDVDSNAYRSYIASVERDENNKLVGINANVDSTFSLYLAKSSANGTVWDVTYNSSVTSVATVTSQGTIRGLSAGTTLITVNYSYARFDELTEQIVVVNAEQEIELFVFLPITEFNIGRSTATIYDVNTIGYYDAGLYSTVDFNVIMNDAYIERSAIRMYINNEAFDIENSSNTYKIIGQNGILFYYGEGRATFLAKIGSDINTATVGIVAEVHEFNRTYRSICNITINRATTVSEIVLYNTNTQVVDGTTYNTLYFRAGLGLGADTDNTQQIRVSTTPVSAVNSGVYYFAYDYEEDNNISSSTQESQIISVSQDGVVTPLRAGSAKVVVVPRDALHNYDLNSDGTLSMSELLLNLQQLQLQGSTLRYKEIIVNVADGTLENPYQISSAVDFLNIATGLDDHYELVQTIDLSRVDLSALGNSETPFTGSINGRFYLENPSEENPNGVYIDSRILGVKLNRTISSATSDVSFGLFGVVKSSVNFESVIASLIPSFRNLYIEFTEYNVDIQGTYSGLTFNLGMLAGQFEGAIDNVQLVMRNPATISNSSQASINFGGFAGVVNQSTYELVNQDGQPEQYHLSSYISNSKLIGGGSITIDNILGDSYIGGFVGVLNQNSSIQGQYAFVNDTVGENNNFVFSFNGQDNDLVFDVNVVVNSAPTLMGVGGIVGRNYGTVQNVAVFGKVSVLNAQNVEQGRNIGGVVGYNSGQIGDVFSRSAVIGGNNVGGIVGFNASSISVAIFESYQDGSSYVRGRESVGGVVGLMQGGTLDYGSSTSFITSDGLYAITGYSAVGGLVGQTANGATISRSQASTKIGVYSNSNLTYKYAGGLVGLANSVNIQNAYSISNLYLLDQVSTFTLGGFIGRTQSGVTIANTYSVSNINNYVGSIQSAPTNNSSFYLNETSTSPSGSANARTSEQLKTLSNYPSPQWDFTITFRMSENVNNGYPYLIYSDSEFITVAPTSLSVIVNETVDNSYIKINDNRVVLFSQQENIENADNYVFSLNDLITLDVSPLTNRIVRVKATLEVGSDVVQIDGGNLIIIGEGYAKIRISSQLNEDVYDYLELYVVNGLNSFSDNTNGELNLLKGTSTEIKYAFENGYNVVGTNYGIAYKDLYNYASFNYSQDEILDDVEYAFVDYNFTKIITALDVVENAPIQQVAYVNANFDGEIIRVLLPWTEKEFVLNIYNGATDFVLDRQQSTIMPSQTASIEALITTDLSSEIVSNITIKNGDNIIENYSISVQTGFEPNVNTILITRESVGTQFFEVDLIAFNFDANTNQLSMTFEFTPTSNLHNINTQLQYDVSFNVQDKLEQDYTINLVPQSVERISALHFPDGNLREDEVATDRISSGVEGLLSINLYPSYSQVDYVDITALPVNGEQMTFVQRVLNNGQLERLYPEAQQIDNGIRLSLASYRGDDGYVFNGYLYVSTLIRSDMPEDLPFVINIVAYKDGQAVYSYSKTLLTQFSPKVTIDYNANYNSQYARGTTINVPLSVTTMAGTLTLTVENNDSSQTITFVANRDTFTGRYVGTITAQLASSINLLPGSTFTIRAQLDTVVDNVRMVVTDELVLTVVDYIILGVAIDGYYTQGSSNMLDINLNTAKALRARIIGVYATRPDNISESSIEAQPYKDILDEIDEFENIISRQHDQSAGDVPVWYTSEQTFDSASGSTGYYNYVYSTSNGGYYSVYGTRVSTVDRITLNVSYYYDMIDGRYQPTLINIATDPTSGKTIYSKSMTCVVNVENDTTEEVPLPIYSQAEFEAMQEGAHYILMNDLVLDTYTPMEATFASLDGNGFIITISSFVIDTSQSTINVGLFASVSTSTLIKNVELNVNPILNNTLNLTGAMQVNVGLFTANNAGSITNCEVVNIVELGTYNGDVLEVTGNTQNTTLAIQTSTIISTSYTTNYIALFAGQNSGYITNSRVGRDSGNIGSRSYTAVEGGNYWIGGTIDLTSNGIVAGFVAVNSNTISSSYAKNISINNNTVIASVSSTAGFVAMNGGTISGSYAEGRSYAEGTIDYANLKSQGNVAGFVQQNDGQVNNSYSSFVIRSPSNSAGFVGVNSEDATIEYSYTSSSVLVADGEVDDNASFRPFTGVNNFNEIQNEGEISYSYYIKDATTVVFADEPAIAINRDAQSQMSEYVGFAFVENSKLKSYGIWSLEDGNTLPQLNTANQIAISQRELASNLDATSQEESLSDPLVYTYVIGYEYGSEINPYIINTAVKFNNYLINESQAETQNGKQINRFGSNIVNIQETAESTMATTKYMRIVNDLNFAQTSETATSLYSSRVTFSAILEGNNMLLYNLTISGEEGADSNQLEFGLFERLEGAVVKNLRLQFNSVSATEIPVVGSLAGSAVDSVILGISVESEGNFVQGKNIVGGLVGVVVGDSEIQSVSSNIGVRATYRRGSTSQAYTDVSFVVGVGNDGQVDDLIYTTVKNNIELIYNGTSYAGGIIGADIMVDGDAQSVRTLQVQGAVSIGAERTGGVVGVNYGNLYDLNFTVNISTDTNNNQELSGDDVVGGIVGVNYNRVDKARISYEGDNLTLVDELAEGVSGGKTNLFIGSSNYIGGLVGSNIGGSIVDSYSRINVVNTNASYAGGVVGYSQGGSYDTIYTTGNVQSSVAFGGMFGYMDEYVVPINDDGTETATEVIDQFRNIVLANNYTLATAQVVNRGTAVAGALAGFANVADISQLFTYIGSSMSNYANYRMPLNTSGTSYVDLQFFGSAQFNRLEIDEEEYNLRLSNLNNFVSTLDGDSLEFGYFDTKTGDFATASYNTLFRNRTTIFEQYSTEDWTKDATVFPMLNITTQATEIIITEDTRENLLLYLAENPNATFIIRCDINLYSPANGGANNPGHLTDNWTSLGSQAIPFSGTFQGERITLEDGSTRYPIINLMNPFINYASNATVSNLTFNIITTFDGNITADMGTNDNFYYGIVANHSESSSFSNLTITNSAVDAYSTMGINITYNRDYSGDGATVNNYIGGVIGYDRNSTVSNVNCSVPIQVTAQTSSTAQTYITTYVGGIVGYSIGSSIANSRFVVKYDSYSNGRVYQPFMVSTSNGYVGGIVGYANPARIASSYVEESMVREQLGNTVPEDSATYPLIVNSRTSRASVTTNVRVGGLVGHISSSVVSDSQNNLSSINLVMNSTYVKNVVAGGLAGIVMSTDFSNVINTADLLITNANSITDNTVSEIQIGGLIGRASGIAQISGSNYGDINIEIDQMTATTGYVGGVVGYVELNASNSIQINRARNSADINSKGLYTANIGGVLGRASLSSTINNQSTIAISQSYNDGDIIVIGPTFTNAQGQSYTRSTIEYVGGLVGYASRLSVNNSYSVGVIESITDTNQAPTTSTIGVSIGGFIGRLEQANIAPQITNSYSATIVRVYGDSLTNSINSHGFIGSTSLSTTYTSAYYVLGFAQTNSPESTQITASMHDATARAVSYYSMLNSSTFTGFSNTVWTFENGNTLPILSWASTSMGNSNAQGSVYRPNLISNATQLSEFTANTGTSLNQYYVLTGTITLDTQVSTRDAFAGVFDGSGFVIIGQNTPLFNTLSTTALVNNVNLQDVSYSLTSAGNYGGLANINNGTISYVSTNGDITFNSPDVAGTTDNITNIGGIVGANYGYIGFSSSNVAITQSDNAIASLINVGGIAGTMDNIDGQLFAQISNTFASATLTLSQNTGTNASYLGGIVGNLLEGNLSECYAYGRINHLNDNDRVAYGAIYGGDNVNNTSQTILDNVTIRNVYNDYLGTLVRSKTVPTGQTVTDITLAEILESGLGGFDPNVWNAFSDDYASAMQNNRRATLLNYGYPYLEYANNDVVQIASQGDGYTSASPYLITNQSGFELINYLNSEGISNSYKPYFALNRDIYCYTPASNETDVPMNIDTLNGILDGSYRTIYNAYVLVNNDNFGFINTITASSGRNSASSLQNVNFEGVTVKIADNFSSMTGVGSIVGTNNGNISSVNISNVVITYENCAVSSGATGEVLSIGGVVGVNSGAITNTNIVNVDFRLGNTKTMSLYTNLGGFVGLMSGGSIGGTTVTENNVNCSVENITIRATSTGGNIHTSAYRNIGGFVGYKRAGNSTIYNCAVRDTNFSGTDTVNTFNILADYTTTSTNINDKVFIGGFVGYSQEENIARFRNNITYTHININVNTNSADTYVGGIAGMAQSVFNDTTVFVYINSLGSSLNLHKVIDGFTNGTVDRFGTTTIVNNSVYQ